MLPWQAERLLEQSWNVEQHGMAKKKLRNTPRAREIKTRMGGVAVVQGRPEVANACLKLSTEMCFTACGPKTPETTMAQCRLAANNADLQRRVAHVQIGRGGGATWRSEL